MKNKGWIIFAILIVAIIVAFAIYKVSGKTNTVVTTSGGSETNSTNGIGELLSAFIPFF